MKETSPRISVTLSAVSPVLLEDKTIVLKLDNSSLKETFDQNFRARLENHLRISPHNGSLKLQTTVETTERGEILIHPTEIQPPGHKNPSLKELKKTFNLDFD
ncbi:MAG: hypothetical protein U5L72_18825 [Bacteroidales bacterium]|nr:hypothetical protein [Bacteroidales bacterium]